MVFGRNYESVRYIFMRDIDILKVLFALESRQNTLARGLRKCSKSGILNGLCILALCVCVWDQELRIRKLESEKLEKAKKEFIKNDEFEGDFDGFDSEIESDLE